MRSDGAGGRRRHLSPGTRAALARTRLIEVVPAGPSRLHSSAPPRSDEPPVVLHALWAPVHTRRTDRPDLGTPLHRAHVRYPVAPTRRGPRPGRRARPVVPFDIPIEAFAVEVGGGAHPSVRSLGDRRLVYVEHRQAVRRTYRRRQLLLAVGFSGAFVATAALALAPGSHAVASSSAPSSDAARPAVVGHSLSNPAVSNPAVSNPAVSNQAGSTRIAIPLVRAHRSPRPSARSRDEAITPANDRPRAPRAGVVGTAPVTPATVPVYGSASLATDPFLVCTRGYESIYAGGYRAVSPGGEYRGAYQFDQTTWNGIATHLKLFSLVGVSPDAAPPSAQDLLAYKLYRWQGARHWQYRCAGLP